MVIVVSYDIADDRRRLRVSRWLAVFGDRVQRSVFECEVDAKARAAMEAGVRERIDERVDSVLFYPLCGTCASRGVAVPARRPVPADVVV